MFKGGIYAFLNFFIYFYFAKRCSIFSISIISSVPDVSSCCKTWQMCETLSRLLKVTLVAFYNWNIQGDSEDMMIYYGIFVYIFYSSRNFSRKKSFFRSRFFFYQQFPLSLFPSFSNSQKFSHRRRTVNWNMYTFLWTKLNWKNK